MASNKNLPSKEGKSRLKFRRPEALQMLSSLVSSEGPVKKEGAAPGDAEKFIEVQRHRSEPFQLNRLLSEHDAAFQKRFSQEWLKGAGSPRGNSNAERRHSGVNHMGFYQHPRRIAEQKSLARIPEGFEDCGSASGSELSDDQEFAGVTDGNRDATNWERSHKPGSLSR